MPAYQILVANRDHHFLCSAEQQVLLAMEQSGMQSIDVGCRGGGCGMCKVRVLEGQYRTLKMSAAHVSEEEQKQGFALACRLLPDSHLVIESDHFITDKPESPDHEE